MFRTLEILLDSSDDMFSIIVSCARESGSWASSSLFLLDVAGKGVLCSYIAAAAAAAPLCCCHLLNKGDPTLMDDILVCGASTEDEAQRRHIEIFVVDLYSFADARDELCNNRDALISPVMNGKWLDGWRCRHCLLWSGS